MVSDRTSDRGRERKKERGRERKEERERGGGGRERDRERKEEGCEHSMSLFELPHIKPTCSWLVAREQKKLKNKLKRIKLIGTTEPHL